MTRLHTQDGDSYDNENGELKTDVTPVAGKLWEVRGFLKKMEDEHDVPEYEPFCYRTPNVVLATGCYSSPNRLHVPGELNSFVYHKISDFERLLLSGELNHVPNPVMIVGAGLSAADAIIAACNHNVPVVHAFRRSSEDRELIFNRLPAKVYPEYHRVLRMMKNQGDEGSSYLPLSQQRVHKIKQDGRVVLCSTISESYTTVKVSFAIVLIGSKPDLSFMPNECRNLGIKPNQSICHKKNPMNVDPITYESVHEPGLFAMGSLVGDNFVRFATGGSVGVTAHVARSLSMI